MRDQPRRAAGSIRRAAATLLLLTFVFLGDVVLRADGAEGAGRKAAESNDKKEGLYLYHGDNFWPVIDYEEDAAKTKEDQVPDFLNSANNGPRVVEFYAPWCPHCQNFRGRYVQVARQVKNLTDQWGTEEVKFYAVSCTAHPQLCQAYNVQGYPALRLIPSGSTNATRFDYTTLVPYTVLNGFGLVNLKISGTEATDEEATETAAAGGPKKGGARPFPARTKQEIYDDANLSLVFTLRYLVFVGYEPLVGERKDALRIWLELLDKILPPGWELRPLARALLQDFDAAAKNEYHFIKIINRFPSKTTAWSESCTKGIPGMGYTCGLWELFHITTVGVVEWNSKVVGGRSDQLVSTVQAADAIFNFIESFFGCDECRGNFKKSYEACALDRCHRLNGTVTTVEQWTELPMWLFETHNAVNVRLMKEQAARENWIPTANDELVRQWPSRNDCPSCTNSDGSWDKITVVKYLRVVYWPDDSWTEKLQKELKVTPSKVVQEGKVPVSLPANFDYFAPVGPKIVYLVPLGVAIILTLLWRRKRSQYSQLSNDPPLELIWS